MDSQPGAGPPFSPAATPFSPLLTAPQWRPELGGPQRPFPTPEVQEESMNVLIEQAEHYERLRSLGSRQGQQASGANPVMLHWNGRQHMRARPWYMDRALQMAFLDQQVVPPANGASTSSPGTLFTRLNQTASTSNGIPIASPQPHATVNAFPELLAKNSSTSGLLPTLVVSPGTVSNAAGTSPAETSPGEVPSDSSPSSSLAVNKNPETLVEQPAGISNPAEKEIVNPIPSPPATDNRSDSPDGRETATGHGHAQVPPGNVDPVQVVSRPITPLDMVRAAESPTGQLAGPVADPPASPQPQPDGNAPNGNAPNGNAQLVRGGPRRVGQQIPPVRQAKQVMQKQKIAPLKLPTNIRSNRGLAHDDKICILSPNTHCIIDNHNLPKKDFQMIFCTKCSRCYHLLCATGQNERLNGSFTCCGKNQLETMRMCIKGVHFNNYHRND